jgi:hypothetical protein
MFMYCSGHFSVASIHLFQKHCRTEEYHHALMYCEKLFACSPPVYQAWYELAPVDYSNNVDCQPRTNENGGARYLISELFLFHSNNILKDMMFIYNLGACNWCKTSHWNFICYVPFWRSSKHFHNINVDCEGGGKKSFEYQSHGFVFTTDYSEHLTRSLGGGLYTQWKKRTRHITDLMTLVLEKVLEDVEA